MSFWIVSHLFVDSMGLQMLMLMLCIWLLHDSRDSNSVLILVQQELLLMEPSPWPISSTFIEVDHLFYMRTEYANISFYFDSELYTDLFLKSWELPGCQPFWVTNPVKEYRSDLALCACLMFKQFPCLYWAKMFKVKKFTKLKACLCGSKM